MAPDAFILQSGAGDVRVVTPQEDSPFMMPLGESKSKLVGYGPPPGMTAITTKTQPGKDAVEETEDRSAPRQDAQDKKTKCVTLPEVPASDRVAQRVGFHPIGTSRQPE